MTQAKLFLENLFPLDLDQVKIKFNQTNFAGEDPLDIWQCNPEAVNTAWLFWEENKQRFRLGDYAVCLIDMQQDCWLLTTIKKITKVLPDFGGVHYEGEELAAYKPYYGRVVIKYHRSDRTGIRKAAGLKEKLEVLQILPTIYDGDAFPGYNKVSLSWSKLQLIISRAKADWVNALKSQKAIYLITDSSNGKLYVGSATGDNGMLLQRWSNYVHSGHGGNKDLKDLPFEHIKKYFNYTILENFNEIVSKDFILERESYWKNVLLSRAYGYNKN